MVRVAGGQVARVARCSDGQMARRSSVQVIQWSGGYKVRKSAGQVVMWSGVSCVFRW